MQALTIKQPWASLIVWGVKDIENRDWKTDYTGVIAVHSSAKLEPHVVQEACNFMRGFVPRFSATIFKREKFPTGSIIGTVEIIGCRREHESPWFVGGYGFVLQNALKFRNPITCKGALGLWTVPENIVLLARAEYRAAKAKSA